MATKIQKKATKKTTHALVFQIQESIYCYEAIAFIWIIVFDFHVLALALPLLSPTSAKVL